MAGISSYLFTFIHLIANFTASYILPPKELDFLFKKIMTKVAVLAAGTLMCTIFFAGKERAYT